MLLQLLSPQEELIGLEHRKKKIMRNLCKKNKLNDIYDSRKDNKGTHKQVAFNTLMSRFNH